MFAMSATVIAVVDFRVFVVKSHASGKPQKQNRQTHQTKRPSSSKHASSATTAHRVITTNASATTLPRTQAESEADLSKGML